MNPAEYEWIISLLGIAAIWLLWYYLWKPQRTDSFREALFDLRDRLFDLAADGVVSFDHPAYTQLRLLINGMIRFAHRVSFPTVILAAAQSRQVQPGEFQAWQRSVQELPKASRDRLLAIHAGLFSAFVRQVVGGSPTLWAYVGMRFAFSVARAMVLLAVGQKGLDSFTVDRARRKVDWEQTQVTTVGAKVIEARVLYEEQRRADVKDGHAFAQ
jgi:hypothetical protein